MTENFSLLGFTSGRCEIYEVNHVEIRCQSKGAEETWSGGPHSGAIIDFVGDQVDSFSNKTDVAQVTICCQEAKIPEQFVSLTRSQ